MKRNKKLFTHFHQSVELLITIESFCVVKTVQQSNKVIFKINKLTNKIIENVDSGVEGIFVSCVISHIPEYGIHIVQNELQC